MKQEISSSGIILGPFDGLHQQDAHAGPTVQEAMAETAREQDRESLEHRLSVTAMGGDIAMIVLGFLASAWLRFYSGWVVNPIDTIELPTLSDYAGLIAFGTLTVFAGLLVKNTYGIERLRSPKHAVMAIAAVTAACLFVFTGTVSVLRTNPPISRLFVIFSFFFIFLTTTAWRVYLGRTIRRPDMSRRLRRRLLVVGSNADADRIKQSTEDDYSTYQYTGWIASDAETDGTPHFNGSGWDALADGAEPPLGTLKHARRIIQQHGIDLVVHADREADRTEILALARSCELEHVEFKMVPRFFEVMVSGLRPGKIGNVPVLGVEALPLNKFENRMLKRLVDIFGAMTGLIVSAPLLLIFGALVRLESPGPVFYRQKRMGRNGRLFEILKIRSMRTDAEPDGKARWANMNDPRCLRVGAFMRRWNIDETPQFWNVLKGEMSLVGPRPERPELIEKFKHEIPHYQARHTCPPGITGWAQVNGLRGNTSLHDRIREDIWYVENWSLWLDVKIAVLTFFRFSNAY